MEIKEIETEIVIHEEIVLTGERNGCHDCPVALGFLECLPGINKVTILGGVYILEKSSQKYENDLPFFVQSWIEEFDGADIPSENRLREFQPFTFCVLVPEWAL